MCGARERGTARHAARPLAARCGVRVGRGAARHPPPAALSRDGAGETGEWR